MKDPNTTTKVVHSQSKSAWNVIGTIGSKYKIARVPYVCTGHDDIDNRNRTEALAHAEFISYAFNNSNLILNITLNTVKK